MKDTFMIVDRGKQQRWEEGEEEKKVSYLKDILLWCSWFGVLLTFQLVALSCISLSERGRKVSFLFISACLVTQLSFVRATKDELVKEVEIQAKTSYIDNVHSIVCTF